MNKANDVGGYEVSTFNPDAMLTNKNDASVLTTADYTIAPDETFLMNETLWPERAKLFGHVYEVMALAVSKDGKLMASSGKSQNKKNANILIWNLETLKQIDSLEAHNSTVIALRFSESGKYLASCSKDRGWTLFRQEEGVFEKVNKMEEVHARIIWDLTISEEHNVVLTASRDKKIKIWNLSTLAELGSATFNNALTAIEILPIKIEGYELTVAVGEENGSVTIQGLKQNSLYKLAEAPKFITHTNAVKRIRATGDSDKCTLATCGDDHTVRIFSIC